MRHASQARAFAAHEELRYLRGIIGRQMRGMRIDPKRILRNRQNRRPVRNHRFLLRTGREQVQDGGKPSEEKMFFIARNDKMGVMPNIRQIIRFSKRIGRRETGPRREIAGGAEHPCRRMRFRSVTAAAKSDDPSKKRRCVNNLTINFYICVIVHHKLT